MADAIVMLLLNTELRVDELVTLTSQRLHLQARCGWIDVVGNGDKRRRLP
jgi:site-specific recombinase XerC